MGDPVTMAMIGASVGAMTNKRDPLKGAMLGAVGGYAGGTIVGGAQGMAGAKLAAAAPSGGAGMAGAGGSGMFTAGTIPAGAAGSSAYMPAVSAPPVAGKAAMAGNALTPLGYSTVASPAMAAPTFMQTVSEIPKAFQSFTGENPVLTQMTLMGAQNALQTPPRPQVNPNLMRGSPIQQQAQRFQTNVPQVSLI